MRYLESLPGVMPAPMMVIKYPHRLGCINSGSISYARYVAWINGTWRRRCRRNLCNPADGGISSPSSAPALLQVAHGGSI